MGGAGREDRRCLLDALDHPIRREILRALNLHREPLCVDELANAWLTPPLSSISYHAGVLRTRGLVRLSGGGGDTRECLESAVHDDLAVAEYLQNHSVGDVELRRPGWGRGRVS
jgi:DNA-binding transcriptional ArsR family regulator